MDDINSNRGMPMKKDNTMAVYIKDMPLETHAIVKAEATRRKIKVQDLYIKAISAGLKRLRIKNDGR